MKADSAADNARVDEEVVQPVEGQKHQKGHDHIRRFAPEIEKRQTGSPARKNGQSHKRHGYDIADVGYQIKHAEQNAQKNRKRNAEDHEQYNTYGRVER